MPTILNNNVNEAGHYIVTAHPAGAVLLAERCSFMKRSSLDVIIVKARRLEVRQLLFNFNSSYQCTDSSLFPLVLSVPVNGRIITLIPFRHPCSDTDLVFFTTSSHRWAIISINNWGVAYNSDRIVTHASGDMLNYHIPIIRRGMEFSHITALEPYARCIAIHFQEGQVIIMPINEKYRYFPEKNIDHIHLKKKSLSVENLIDLPYHLSINEIPILDMTFLYPSTSEKSSEYSLCSTMPQLALLYRDSRECEYCIVHSIDLQNKSLVFNYNNVENKCSIHTSGPKSPIFKERLKQTDIDGRSGMLIAVPTMSWNKDSRVSLKQDNDRISQIMGGVLILGSRHITYVYYTTEKGSEIIRVPIAETILVSFSRVHKSSDDSAIIQYLVGDENGVLYLLVIQYTNEGHVNGLYWDVLGLACCASSSLVYLGYGHLFAGNQFGDSQLLLILESPEYLHCQGDKHMNINDNHHNEMTYIRVLEEYTNLGPIVDFDLISNFLPTNNGCTSNYDSNSPRSMMIAASGVGKDGSIRLICNGVKLSVYASIKLEGIQYMWSLRRSFNDEGDVYLVQSYVSETVILGYNECKLSQNKFTNEINSTNKNDHRGSSYLLESFQEVDIPGFDVSRSTLYTGNVSLECSDSTDSFYKSSFVVQITEFEIRLIDLVSGICDCIWSPTLRDCNFSDLNLFGPDLIVGNRSFITVATANEAGQICTALVGGVLMSFQACADTGRNLVFICVTRRIELGYEVSCINLNPFRSDNDYFQSRMDVKIDGGNDISFSRTNTNECGKKSHVVAIGLWDDPSVRLLSLRNGETLNELCCISLKSDEVQSNFSQYTLSGRCTISCEMVHQPIARSLCLSTLSLPLNVEPSSFKINEVNMLFIGLSNGRILCFIIELPSITSSLWSFHSRNELDIGSIGITLVPFQCCVSGHRRAYILATGNIPVLLYLVGGRSRNCITDLKLCYAYVHQSFPYGIFKKGNNIVTGKRKPHISVATIFYSSPFNSSPTTRKKLTEQYSVCYSDDSTLHIGIIDSIHKLHVTKHPLGMTPRRIVYHKPGHVICVGCIDTEPSGDGLHFGGDINMGNCIRFFDDVTLEQIGRINLEPFEMITSLVSVYMKVVDYDHLSDLKLQTVFDTKRSYREKIQDYCFHPFIVIGTLYAFPDQYEPSRGRVLLIRCSVGVENDAVDEWEKPQFCPGDRIYFRPFEAKQFTELITDGGVFSVCQFYNGTILMTINKHTHLCILVRSESGDNIKYELRFVGEKHNGRILSLCVRSLIVKNSTEKITKHDEDFQYPQLAIVGDLMQSISLLQYSPEYQSLQEVARDFNQRGVTVIEMLTNDVYIVAEDFHNIFILRRSIIGIQKKVKWQIDTVGIFHLGEVPNNIMKGSLVLPFLTLSFPEQHRRDTSCLKFSLPIVKVGSQTLFVTSDGTIGCVVGLDIRTYLFFNALQCSMSKIVTNIGNLCHKEFRSFWNGRYSGPSRGFVDGDLVESFLDLNYSIMKLIVKDINENGKLVYGRREDDVTDKNNNKHFSACSLTVSDVVSMIQEISILH